MPLGVSGGCFQGGLIKKERPIPNPCGTIPRDGSLWLDIFLIHLPVFSHEFVMMLDHQDNMIVFSVSLIVVNTGDIMASVSFMKILYCLFDLTLVNERPRCK